MRKESSTVQKCKRQMATLGFDSQLAYHRVKLILKIYRDVVWVLSERVEELHEYAWELGDQDADTGLIYLQSFAPDMDLQEFEERVCCVMENRMLVDVIDRALLRLKRYRAYCRTRWNIKDNDQSFFDHEIQTSGMIGSQDGAYENFREFIDAINTPEHIILEQIKKEALYQAISALPAADQALVQGLFFKGQSELDYAREIGVSQPAVHKRKVRILKSLKKLLEN